MAAPLFSFGDNLINWNGLTSFVFKNLFFAVQNKKTYFEKCLQISGKPLSI